MKILIVGGGGREHTIAWKIAQSPLVSKIYCAPGNGGISKIARCIPIKAMDIEGIVKYAKDEQIDLVVVAPDDPLGAGMVDALENVGIRAFGPRQNAAVIESSKSFSKDLMKKYGIPTAKYEVFDDNERAMEYLCSCKYPTVVKADGLAQGKGVIIAREFKHARDAVVNIMGNRIFGNAGDRVIIEEFLTGPEVSVLAFTDGKSVVPMVSSQDYKRALDNDEGLNTGGMGAFSPSRIYTPRMAAYCMERIYIPTINAMNKENRKFKGVLYFGLMITEDGPKVIEYNSRFGDPEAQVVLPRLKNDIVEIFNAVIDEKLDTVNIEWEDNCAVCVIAASGGYPQQYQMGYEISGIADAELDPDTIIFHSGTRYMDAEYYTAGGRVLGVTSVADTMDGAIKKAYEGIGKISFKDMHYRKDIGVKQKV